MRKIYCIFAAKSFSIWQNIFINLRIGLIFAVVSAALGEVRLLQGKILGQIHSLGFASKEEKILEILTFDVVKSSEIEGEKLNYEQVSFVVKR